MPDIRLFQAAFGRRLRGQRSLGPPGATSTADALVRIGGLGLVLTGVLLIGAIIVGTQDTQWLSSITVGAANNQCDDKGKPTGCFFTPPEDTGSALAPLKTVQVPQDPRLKVGGDYIRNQEELVELGKALFWDQQVGSDGQACGSCHFSAGADPRTQNAVSPGLKATPVDTTFSLGAAESPNYQLVQGDFPSHLLANPDRRGSTVLRDSNDVVGSAGVFNRKFTAVGSTPILNNPNRVPSVPDVCRSVADPDGFQRDDINVRKVEPRNTPTMINAVFNNRNFWDGRAQDIFNGVTPFGARDPSAAVYQKIGDTLKAGPLNIKFASLASQSVGPPLSNFEMSCENRTFPDVGHKLLGLRPLALQVVARNDKVLGPLVGSAATGLNNIRYRDMVQQAFNPQWWSSRQAVAIGDKTFSQMEANFSMFWGLSLKGYMETLIADKSPVDQFLQANGHSDAISDSAKRGLNIFQSFNGVAPDPSDPTGTKTIDVKLSTGKPADARCITCHGSAATTNATVNNVQSQRIERMKLRNGTCAIYDQGYLTTGVRPQADDPAVDALDPFNNSFAETFLAQAGSLTRLVPGVPQDAAPYGLDQTADPNVTGPALGGTSNCENQAIRAAFKTPGLRNVELTGPYFHNGGQVTLMQVVDFYNRGGDFNNPQLDANIKALGLAERDKRDLVNFLMALTDQRVAYEKAPFDHPSICVANGQQGDDSGVPAGPSLPGGGQTIAADRVLCIPASGANGIAHRLPTFLHVDQHDH
jgi:cytochrome c peroxidase